MLFYFKLINKQKPQEQKTTLVKFSKINFDIEVIGCFARVTATHFVTNTNPTPIDLSINFAYDNQSAVVGYSYKVNDKEVISSLKEIEAAKKEIADAKSSGYSTSDIQKTDDRTLVLSLGNLDTTKTAECKIVYVTRLLVINDDLVLASTETVKDETDAEVTIEHIGDTSSPKSTFTKKLSEITTIPLGKIGNGIYITDDEDLEEKTGLSVFVSDEKVGPVDAIFVCDRSGSMYGKGITSLKSALQLFLRQLPTDSTFDIVSFGSQFDSLFSGLKKYDETSFDFASKAVEKFESNYGGTF
ncbi:hypothetical protein EIN_454920, partial [Entamoeba invadens IP1]